MRRELIKKEISLNKMARTYLALGMMADPFTALYSINRKLSKRAR